MFRTLRLTLILIVVSMAAAVPIGMALGGFATGQAPSTRLAGSTLPDQGTQWRSATHADALQPAAVAYTQHDRYAAAAASWVD